MVKGYCRDCSYPLEQLTENKCPECGRKFQPDAPYTWDPTPAARRHRCRQAFFDTIQWAYIILFGLVTLQLFVLQVVRQIHDKRAGTAPYDPMMTSTLDLGSGGQNVNVFVFCLSLLLSIILGWIIGRRAMND